MLNMIASQKPKETKMGTFMQYSLMDISSYLSLGIQLFDLVQKHNLFSFAE